MTKQDKKPDYEFPKDLIDVQVEIDEVRAELRKLLARQPWSVEPMAAWATHENAWRQSSRPDSPGWDPADTEQIDKLRKRELALAEVLVTHRFWSEVASTERQSARDLLKHVRTRASEEATA